MAAHTHLKNDFMEDEKYHNLMSGSFDVWTSYLGVMGQYDPMFDLKINVGLCDLYFMVQWFCLISKTIWCMSVIFSDNETVWPKRLDRNINISQHDLYVMV